MAHKKKKLNQERHAAIMMHVHALNLRTINQYEDWCSTNGFNKSTKKSLAQCKKEYQFNQNKITELIFKKHNKESQIRSKIKQIYKQELKFVDIDNEVLQAIFDGFNNQKHPKCLYELLLHLEAKTKLLNDTDCIRGIVGLVNHRNKWIRKVEHWMPTSHNRERQFASIARHLLAKYDVPSFMDNVWYTGNKKHQAWFIHIAEGKNIRTAESLPIALTKKMAHYFLQAPHNYSALNALRWAQISALGGNKNLVNAINATRLGRRFKDNAFWAGVIRFFIDNPMLDVAQVNPIVDYIWNQKYEHRVEFVAHGVAREIEPAQPNFSIKGRTPDTLLRQVDRWHRQLGRESRGGNLQWRKAKIHDYKYIEGNVQRSNMKVWTIRELLNSKELIAEGRAQGHCVASYAHSCHNGRCTIWTMDMQDDKTITKKVTIEINMTSKQICQVRGKGNRLPTDAEVGVLRRWAQKERINIADYLML